MKRYLRLYSRFLGQYLKSLMEYRVDFWVGMGGFLVIQATGVAFIYMVFQKIPQLNGWDFHQILFIYGFSQVPRAIDHLLTDNLWLLAGNIIVKGEFDRYLVRPVSPLFHLLAERFQPDAFGEMIIGVGLLIYSMIRMHLTMSPGQVGLFILAILAGTVIYFAIKLAFASLAFWVKSSQSILFMMYTFSEFAKYPTSIFSPFIRGVVTFALPFVFTAFVPASYFLGRDALLPAIGGTVLAAVISCSLALLLWRAGIRRYESAGS